MVREVKLTPAGKAEIENKIRELHKKAQKLRHEMREGRQMGDLRENAGFNEARVQLGVIENQIRDMMLVLNHAKVVESPAGPAEAVDLGCRVTVTALESAEQREYTLVTPFEVSPANGKISTESPLGAALMGAKVGDTVEAQLPAGLRCFRIEIIQR